MYGIVLTNGTFIQLSILFYAEFLECNEIAAFGHINQCWQRKHNLFVRKYLHLLNRA